MIFVRTKSDQKKIQLTFCGLRNVATVRRLNESHHKCEKRRTKTASTVLAAMTPNYWLPSTRIASKEDAAPHTFLI